MVSTTTRGVAASRGSCSTASASACAVRRSPPDRTALSAPTALVGPRLSGAGTAGGPVSTTAADRAEAGSCSRRSVAPFTVACRAGLPAADPSTTSASASRSDSTGLAVLGTGASPTATAKSSGRGTVAGTGETEATSDTWWSTVDGTTAATASCPTDATAATAHTVRSAPAASSQQRGEPGRRTVSPAPRTR